MATPPDFSAGAVLTAAQMNAVGLWLIKTGSYTAKTNEEITGVFSSDFDNYRIQVRVTAMSAAQILQMRMGTTAGTAYFSVVNGLDQGGAATSTIVNGGAQWNLLDAGSGFNVGQSFSIDVFGPQLAVKTTAHGTVTSSDGAGFNNGVFGGSLNNTTQYTSFSILSSAGNWDLTYYVYGYRK